MTGWRNRYSTEFKAKMALEALRGGDGSASGRQARHPPDDGQRLEETGPRGNGHGVFRQGRDLRP